MPSSETIHAVYAIVGADRFLRHQAMTDLVSRLNAADATADVTRFDGSDAELADVLDELRTCSLLGGRRAALVDDADEFISRHRPALERYCEQPVADATLILLCQSLPSNTRLFRIIRKGGAVVKCEPMKTRELVDWAVRHAESHYAKRLPRAAANALVEHVGDAAGAIDSEIGKLAAFVGSRPDITSADVDAATGRIREEKVFAVIDAMAEGDIAAAIRHWEQVLATDRAAPGRAIGGLAWGVRRLLAARRDFDRGVNIFALSKRTFTDPEVLRRRLQRLTVAQLEQQQKDLLAADLAVKTSASTTETAVESFIIKHGTAAQRAPAAMVRE